MSDLVADSPAAKAGIRKDDVIVAIDKCRPRTHGDARACEIISSRPANPSARTSR